MTKKDCKSAAVLQSKGERLRVYWKDEMPKEAPDAKKSKS